MKKLVAGLAIVSLIAVGALAYAHGTAYQGSGLMTGSGYGGHMMGQRYGGHMMSSMMGWGNSEYGYDQKFLDKTTKLRKELHNKRFEYFEAIRNQKTTPETIAKLEKEIRELQKNVKEKAPVTASGDHAGYGCW